MPVTRTPVTCAGILPFRRRSRQAAESPSFAQPTSSGIIRLVTAASAASAASSASTASGGYFFVLDGLDGCGKSTQSRELARFLRAEQGLEVVEVRDPGATPVGEHIRELLLGVRANADEDLRPTT
jgi:hypothetical protein